jgi:hypothetical protein
VAILWARLALKTVSGCASLDREYFGMTLGPILAVRNVRAGPVPQTGADPRYVIVEVQTKTSMGDFLELEMTRDAAMKMSGEIARFLNEKWEPDDHD